MRRLLFTLASLTLLTLVGCSASSPEALAEDFAAAMKSGDLDRIVRIAEKVEKLSAADRQRYDQALGKIMLKDFGNGLPGMDEFPKLEFGK